MMDDVISHSRKPVVCRYFAASGTCFYGNDCQFLHNSISRSSTSPTFPLHFVSSPTRSANSTTASISTELSLSIIESNGFLQSFKKNVNKSTFSNYALSVKDECMHKAQELSISPDLQTAGGSNSSLFEENVGGTTYYYTPEDDVKPNHEDLTVRNHGGQATDKIVHNSVLSRRVQSPNQLVSTSQQPNHLFSVYNGPSSFLQSCTAQQGSSFFMNEDIRAELVQRNLVALLASDPALFPDLPSDVDHYHELVPLETHTLNQAVKSNTYGLITSTYKASNSKTGIRYCLKRIHGYRVTSAKCMSMVELWRKVQQCHLVTLREAFTTKAFGDHSMVFAYDYYPGAETLMSKYLASTAPHSDPFSSDPSAPRPYTMQKNRMLQQQAGKGVLPESLLWSYIIELCSALRCVHSAGLAVRALDASKVLVTSRGRLRLCGGGIFDVLTYDSSASNASALIPHYQQEDLLALGKLILALACNSLLALQRDNVPTSMDIINKNYSSDLRNLVMYLLSTPQGSRAKNIQEVMPMIGARFFSQLEAVTLHADYLEDQLARELDNGRLFRLLGKLGTVVDRPELNLDSTWSETGDRYLLKLFRDYMLHPCTDDGRPWVDLAHIVACLNRLDTASHDKICLTSRDQQNVLVVSYAELHQCLETSFNELQQAALPPSHVLGASSSNEQ
ncbi:PAN2-PAN3 deadenylation complex subunit pan3-like isoform X1 [Daphnia carinata]|uniref:PAN2-PAN3 deadenylation complex subunit pan3-like isoform X1 n=1 Tax=Daphnia carinata TaxID=120202 RepID=UPI0025811B65|nr:PAN2-PAN3 deadenylation complex subunit pan3-like isoform X1 [Daphnia carinata]